MSALDSVVLQMAPSVGMFFLLSNASWVYTVARQVCFILPLLILGRELTEFNPQRVAMEVASSTRGHMHPSLWSGCQQSCWYSTTTLGRVSVVASTHWNDSSTWATLIHKTLALMLSLSWDDGAVSKGDKRWWLYVIPHTHVTHEWWWANSSSW